MYIIIFKVPVRFFLCVDGSENITASLKLIKMSDDGFDGPTGNEVRNHTERSPAS